ncbi:hypothetical protein V8J88_00535 [Massilia sp. W12]|uniref:hypothetical protein n=1 Tax=Massilia sp. W12 TaxID=3126507 RepID=UPI0030D1BEC2
MRNKPNSALLCGAALSAFAAFLHLCIIVGGGPWYRFFGAGEGMAAAAEAGSLYPALITAGIACVLAGWAAYALSGAGLIRRLPWCKAALCLITAIYLLRGLALFPAWLFVPQQVGSFEIWSSLICLAYGLTHALGLWQVWPQFKQV